MGLDHSIRWLKKKCLLLLFLLLRVEGPGHTRRLALTLELGPNHADHPTNLGFQNPQQACAILPLFVGGLWLADDVGGGDACRLVAAMAGVPAVVQEVVAVFVGSVGNDNQPVGALGLRLRGDRTVRGAGTRAGADGGDLDVAVVLRAAVSVRVASVSDCGGELTLRLVPFWASTHPLAVVRAAGYEAPDLSV